MSCRQASRLITAQLDRPLSAFERISLEVHLKICTACPIVIRQLDLIGQSVHQWRATVEAPTE